MQTRITQRYAFRQAQFSFASDGELAQIRNTIASALYFIARNRWRPSYPSVATLMASCDETQDPLGTR